MKTVTDSVAMQWLPVLVVFCSPYINVRAEVSSDGGCALSVCRQITYNEGAVMLVHKLCQGIDSVLHKTSVPFQ